MHLITQLLSNWPWDPLQRQELAGLFVTMFISLPHNERLHTWDNICLRPWGLSADKLACLMLIYWSQNINRFIAHGVDLWWCQINNYIPSMLVVITYQSQRYVSCRQFLITERRIQWLYSWRENNFVPMGLLSGSHSGRNIQRTWQSWCEGIMEIRIPDIHNLMSMLNGQLS